MTIIKLAWLYHAQLQARQGSAELPVAIRVHSIIPCHVPHYNQCESLLTEANQTAERFTTLA